MRFFIIFLFSSLFTFAQVEFNFPLNVGNTWVYDYYYTPLYISGSINRPVTWGDYTIKIISEKVQGDTTIYYVDQMRSVFVVNQYRDTTYVRDTTRSTIIKDKNYVYINIPPSNCHWGLTPEDRIIPRYLPAYQETFTRPRTIFHNNIGLTLRETRYPGSNQSSMERYALISYTIVPLSIIEETNSIVLKDFSLLQNYPNPFNPSTTITYSIPEDHFVELKVYDVLGNEVAVLVNDYKPAGTFAETFDASKLTSGVYFYKLSAGSFSQTKKLLLVK